MDKNELRIALVLYQLSKRNQYGAELLDNIAQATEGTVEIKSAQLYSLMKSLSSSGLVQSYWEDSSIGGKRHYYRITERGTSALSQYPSEQDIIKDLIKDKYSNLKNIDFDSQQIDTASSYDLNVMNTELAMDTPTVTKSEQVFLGSKINDKINIRLDKKVFESLSGENNNEADITSAPSISQKHMHIERRDYKDYSSDPEMLARKKLFDRINVKFGLSFAIQVLTIVACYILTRKFQDTMIINIFMGICSISAIAYIWTFIAHFKTLRYTILDGKYTFNAKKNILRSAIISVLSFLTQLLVVFVCNATKLTSTNYNQLYAMLALSLLPLINSILNMIFIRIDKR